MPAGWLSLSSYYYAFPAWPPLIVAACLGILALAIPIRERFSLLSLSFTLLCGSVALWLSSVGAMYSTTHPIIAKAWSQAMFTGVTLIPAASLDFILALTRTRARFRWMLNSARLLALAMLAAGFLTSGFIQGLHEYPWGYYPQQGPWAGFFFLYFYSVLGTALGLLWTRVRAQTLQPQKQQLRFFLIAFAVSLMASIDFLASDGRWVYPVGYLPVYASLLIFGQVIWRYRFADITPATAGHQIMDTTPTPLWVLDAHGIISLVNRAAEADFAESAHRLIGSSIETVLPGLWTTETLARLKEQSPLRLEEFQRRDRRGRLHWYDLSISTIPDSVGQPLAYVCVALDQTHRREAEQRRRLFSDIVEHMQTGIVVLRLENPADNGSLRILAANPAASVVSGASLQPLIGMRLQDAFGGLSAQGLPAKMAEVARSGRELDFGEIRYGDARVPEGVFHVKAFPLPDQCVGVGFENVTRRVSTEQALNETEERFRLLIESVQDYAIILLDPNGVVATWNIGAQRITGFTADEIIGRNFSCFYTPLDRESGDPARSLEDALRQGRVEIEGWRLRKDGSQFRANIVLSALKDRQGRLRGYAKVTRDISERYAAQEELRQAHEELEQRVEQRTLELKEEIERRRQAENALRQQSLTDALTGLFNRRGFLTLAEQQLQVSRRENRALLLLMIDLDGLKPINDTFGHMEGDQAIREAAAILRSTFRSADIVARIGGDEFAVMTLEDGAQNAGEVVKRLRGRIDDRNRVHGRSYTLSLSVGTARMSPEGSLTLSQLMSQADERLYEEKRRKPDRAQTLPPGAAPAPKPPQL